MKRVKAYKVVTEDYKSPLMFKWARTDDSRYKRYIRNYKRRVPYGFVITTLLQAREFLDHLREYDSAYWSNCRIIQVECDENPIFLECGFEYSVEAIRSFYQTHKIKTRNYLRNNPVWFAKNITFVGDVR